MNLVDKHIRVLCLKAMVLVAWPDAIPQRSMFHGEGRLMLNTDC